MAVVRVVYAIMAVVRVACAILAVAYRSITTIRMERSCTLPSVVVSVQVRTYTSPKPPPATQIEALPEANVELPNVGPPVADHATDK